MHESKERILSSQDVTVLGLKARYEVWSWDGFHGASLVFKSIDLNRLSDQQIKKEITSEWSESRGQEMDVKRGEENTYVNWHLADFEV